MSNGPTRDDVLRMARESGLHVAGVLDCEPFISALERFSALAYAAGQAAERAEKPPAPLVVDASHIDSEALAEAIAEPCDGPSGPSERAPAMKRARPVLVAGTPNPDDIAAAVTAEREACAKAVIDLWRKDSGATADDFAAAIRARGAK